MVARTYSKDAVAWDDAEVVEDDMKVSLPVVAAEHSRIHCCTAYHIRRCYYDIQDNPGRNELKLTSCHSLYSCLDTERSYLFDEKGAVPRGDVVDTWEHKSPLSADSPFFNL